MRAGPFPLVVLSLLAALPGCTPETRREGPQTVRVTGTVTLDGKPVEGAIVRFSPETKGPAAFAVSDRYGRYELRTFDPGDGAIPGKYGVSVTKEVTEGGKEFDSQGEREAYVDQHGKGSSGRTTVSVLPEKYSSKQSSGLTADVFMAKKNHFNLPLTSR